MKTFFLSKPNSFKLFTKCFLLLLLIEIISTKSIAQQSNFSGSWTLNTDKTDFGKLSENSTPVMLNINQKKDSISIERISKNGQGELRLYTETLPVNGDTVGIKLNLIKKTASVNLSTNGQTLIETATYNDKKAPIEYATYDATETWTLSENGKTLTIDRVDELPKGRYFKKMVYDRQ